MSFGPDGFRKFDEPMRMGMMGMGDRAPAAPKPELELGLKQPSRKATKIVTIRGEVEVMSGGTRKQVDVSGLAARVGKTVEDPALKQAGIEVEVMDPKQAEEFMMGDGEQQGVALRISGNLVALAEVDLVDARGQSVSQGKASSESDGVRKQFISMAKAPDAGTRLRLSVDVGQKLVIVPIELKEVPLP
jgi:hypothetical protein